MQLRHAAAVSFGSIQLALETVSIDQAYAIAEMGTSGLRLSQEQYNRPLFFEQFVQGIADYFVEELAALGELADASRTVILGGDPRMGNQDRIKLAAEILVANGLRVIIAQDGLASTPAMSHAIRQYEALGGLIFTASHNPFTDAGIKVNKRDGSGALTDTTRAIANKQNALTEFKKINYREAVDAGVIVDNFAALASYADLLDGIFDFASMRQKVSEMEVSLGRKLSVALDAMHGAAGPFAYEVFINRLGLDAKLLHGRPDPRLGTALGDEAHAFHPEPDFSFLPELIKLNATGAYDLVAAWDADVDRRLDGGSGFWVESADEAAIFAKYGPMIGLQKLFNQADGQPGTIYFCRSTVTAHAIDLMGEQLQAIYGALGYQVKIVETPTGFRWIAELGNNGVEESNGHGNPYIREKDGIYASVFLLKIMLETGKTPRQLMEEIWKASGRVYFTRGEVSGTDVSQKTQLTDILNNAARQVGKNFGTLTLEAAESWDYVHPVSGKVADKGAAYVLRFSDGNVIKARYSGTGTGAWLLRVYASKEDQRYDIPKSDITQPMKDAFDAFLRANGFAGKSEKYTDAEQPDPYKT